MHHYFVAEGPAADLSPAATLCIANARDAGAARVNAVTRRSIVSCRGRTSLLSALVCIYIYSFSVIRLLLIPRLRPTRPR